MKHPIHIIGLGPGRAPRGAATPEREGSGAAGLHADGAPPADRQERNAAPAGCKESGEENGIPPYASLLSAEARRILDNAEILIGGRAQLALFEGHPASTLTVGADTDDLYARIRAHYEAGRRQAALCSGDALFYGLGARLAEQLGADAVRVLPGVSSLQAAAAVLGLPWERAIAVSLHGRPDFAPLAHALLQAEGTDAPVFVLTDAASGPEAVAAWMLERGLGAMRMHVLEDLFIDADGSARARRVYDFRIDEAQEEQTGRGEKTPDREAARQGAPSAPRQCVLWLRNVPEAPAFGISDRLFARENSLMTKAPVRAAGLACLGVAPGHTVWDLGAGSGSVAVEAARLARRGRVYAVEREADRAALIRENRRRFRALNLEIIEGAMPFCLSALPPPDRVFIGGGLGGNADIAADILARAWQALRPGGRLLAHCVLLSSLERVRARLLEFGATVDVAMLQAATGAPLAGDMRLEALNPVFLVLGEKAE